MRCLISLKSANSKVPFEVIVIDDHSTDWRIPELLGKLEGLKFIRNQKNLGFIQSCNLAAQKAIGRYLLILNNDVEVLDNWLDELVSTFEFDVNVGCVGAKLIYPDGKLQEAGGIIWEDASGWNYGRGDDPDNPKYNYIREVDYCSGACLLIKKEIWEKLGGFDELFVPAYYEDTDLCFRVREIGYKVVYQPFARVIHYEGVSSGTDINSGVKSYQKVNQLKFREKWKNILSYHLTSEKLNELQIRNRFAKKFVLFIDATTPTPDKDSGSIDSYNFMKIIRSLGCAVTFIPQNLAHFGEYTVALQKEGVEVLYYPFITSIADFLLDKGDLFDFIILSRITVAREFIHLIRNSLRKPKIIFNTVDLHFLRQEREALLKNDVSLFEQAQKTRQEEIQAIGLSDITLLVSNVEKELISNLVPSAKTIVMPIPRHIPGRSNGFDNRKGLLFLGGFQHLPNVDAVEYFLEEIWPLIRKDHAEISFIIAGSNMPAHFYSMDGKDGIRVLGYVKDLSDLFENIRISVAPLRYGAGVKGKIVTSLSYGVPCVATSIAAEGMGLKDGENILIADSPNRFVESILRIYKSPDIWENLSTNGLAFVKEKYSINAAKMVWSKILFEGD